jgi:hypothetical protein
MPGIWQILIVEKGLRDKQEAAFWIFLPWRRLWE